MAYEWPHTIDIGAATLTRRVADDGTYYESPTFVFDLLGIDAAARSQWQVLIAAPAFSVKVDPSETVTLLKNRIIIHLISMTLPKG